MTKTHNLTFHERERIGILLAQRYSIREVGRRINRDHSCIIRELKKTKSTPLTYSAIEAELYAFKQRHKTRRICKIESNEKLKEYIHKKLEKRWSPEQIARTLKRIYPMNQYIRISTFYREENCVKN